MLFESSGKESWHCSSNGKPLPIKKTGEYICWEEIKNYNMHMMREIFTLYRKATPTLENSARSTVRKLVYTRKIASTTRRYPFTLSQGHGQGGFVVQKKKLIQGFSLNATFLFSKTK